MTKIKVKGCKLSFAVRPNSVEFTTLYKLGGYTSEYEISSESTTHQGAYIAGNSGADSNTAFSTWGRTDYIAIDSAYHYFTWQGKTQTNTAAVSIGLVMFFDEQKHLIGSFCIQRDDNSLVEGEGALIKVYERSDLPVTAITKSSIPAEAKYVRACCLCGEGVDFRLTLYKN